MYLFHASNLQANQLRLHDSPRTSNEEDTHANSVLGLWTDNVNLPYLRGFGGNVYRIGLKPGTRIQDVSLGVIAAWGRHLKTEADYLAIRREFLAQGIQVLRIVEHTEVGHNQHVILTMDVVVSVSLEEGCHEGCQTSQA